MKRFVLVACLYLSGVINLLPQQQVENVSLNKESKEEIIQWLCQKLGDTYVYPLSQDTFFVDENKGIKLEFVTAESGKTMSVKLVYEDGYVDEIERTEKK